MAAVQTTATPGLLSQTTGLAKNSPYAMGAIGPITAFKAPSLIPATPPTAPGSSTGLGSLIKPSTPVKSIQLGSDGGQTVTYHTPPTDTPKPTTTAAVAPTYSSSGGAVIPTGGAPGTPLVPPASSVQTNPPAQNTAAVTFPGVVGGLTGFDPFKNPQVSDAYQNALKAQAELENLKQQEAEALKTAGSQPMPIGDLLGREGLLANYYTAKENAAAQALAGYGSIYQGGFTGTGQQEAALGTAGGLAQPSGAFPFVFSPTTGTFSAPGVVGAAGSTAGAPTLTYNPQTDATSLAQAVMNRKISYNDAVNALSYGSNSSAAPGQLSSAIIAAGGNPTDLQAQATGQASVAGSIPSLQSANTAAQGIAQTINGFLQQNPQINASPLAVGNLAQQWLQGKQLADPAYQTFFNYLSEYANTLAPVLGVGGDPTNMKTQIAQAFLNPQASGQSTMQVLEAMGQLATDKIKNLQSGATGGGVVTTPPSSTSTGGLYDF